MRRFVFVALIALLPIGGFAQVVDEDKQLRAWLYTLEDGDPDDPAMMILAQKFDEPGPAYAEWWYVSQLSIVDERHLQNPEQVEGLKIEYWCNVFLGETPLHDGTDAQGILYLCNVGEMVYTIILSANGIRPYLPDVLRLAEEMILYDQPATPEGWIDISKDLEEKYS